MPGLPTLLPWNETVGETIPPDTPHAVSVSLPTWKANVAYEEGERWVLDKMQCGYPRFFIHPSIERLAQTILQQHGSPDTNKAMLFPSRRCAGRCKDFLYKQNPNLSPSSVSIFEYVPHVEKAQSGSTKRVLPRVSAVVYPKELWPTTKAFWQHTGEGISSRHAEFCQRALDDGSLVEQGSETPLKASRLSKGPRRYQRPMSVDHSDSNGTNGNANGHVNGDEKMTNESGALFVEERYGRNLSADFAAQAKLAVRKRIAGALATDMDVPHSTEEADGTTDRSRDVPGFSVDNVYLYPMGMNAIYQAHRALMIARGEKPSIMYGFPYVDTLKVLEKFGPGVAFYGHGNTSDLDDLERKLEGGERYLALFCEFPGNPLLRTPDLPRIRALADKYDFAVVVDETIGNFLNVHVLPYADVVVSSLTKIFSGDCNVMGGSMIVNPHSQYYTSLRTVLGVEYEDNQFEEDSIYLERNSRDYVERIDRVNHNAEAIVNILRAHPAIKQVNYPKYDETRKFYDACRLPNGGYGGLLSATFYSLGNAEVFYDHLQTQKGPSLGTNFTLSSPFVLLAHYNELDWAAQYGCEASLIRFSVGLEETEALKAVFHRALAAIPTRIG